MENNFDPTWPAAQRLLVIEALAYRMRSAPYLVIRQYREMAEVVQDVASMPARFLEENRKKIHEALAR